MWQGCRVAFAMVINALISIVMTATMVCFFNATAARCHPHHLHNRVNKGLSKRLALLQRYLQHLGLVVPYGIRKK
jgi:hypothetical protein